MGECGAFSIVLKKWNLENIMGFWFSFLRFLRAVEFAARYPTLDFFEMTP